MKNLFGFLCVAVVIFRSACHTQQGSDEVDTLTASQRKLLAWIDALHERTPQLSGEREGHAFGILSDILKRGFNKLVNDIDSGDLQLPKNDFGFAVTTFVRSLAFSRRRKTLREQQALNFPSKRKRASTLVSSVQRASSLVSSEQQASNFPLNKQRDTTSWSKQQLGSILTLGPISASEYSGKLKASMQGLSPTQSFIRSPIDQNAESEHQKLSSFGQDTTAISKNDAVMPRLNGLELSDVTHDINDQAVRSLISSSNQLRTNYNESMNPNSAGEGMSSVSEATFRLLHSVNAINSSLNNSETIMKSEPEAREQPVTSNEEAKNASELTTKVSSIGSLHLHGAAKESLSISEEKGVVNEASKDSSIALKEKAVISDNTGPIESSAERTIQKFSKQLSKEMSNNIDRTVESIHDDHEPLAENMKDNLDNLVPPDISDEVIFNNDDDSDISFEALRHLHSIDESKTKPTSHSTQAGKILTYFEHLPNALPNNGIPPVILAALHDSRRSRVDLGMQELSERIPHTEEKPKPLLAFADALKRKAILNKRKRKMKMEKKKKFYRRSKKNQQQYYQQLSEVKQEDEYGVPPLGTVNKKGVKLEHKWALKTEPY